MQTCPTCGARLDPNALLRMIIQDCEADPRMIILYEEPIRRLLRLVA